jgi:hypothetical protein
MNPICRVDLDDDGNHYLKSDSFSPLADANDVMIRAEELIARINGAMKAMFPDFQPIYTSELITLHENGNRGVVIMPDSATSIMRAGRPTISVSGNAPTTPQPSDAERWLELSANDDDVADALHYLSRNPNWFDLYKLYEVVCTALGGRKKMLALLSTGDSDGGAFRRNIKLFTQTANTVCDIRHARPTNEQPEAPMQLGKASRVLRDLVTRYLKHRRPSGE